MHTRGAGLPSRRAGPIRACMCMSMMGAPCWAADLPMPDSTSSIVAATNGYRITPPDGPVLCGLIYYSAGRYIPYRTPGIARYFESLCSYLQGMKSLLHGRIDREVSHAVLEIGCKRSQPILGIHLVGSGSSPSIGSCRGSCHLSVLPRNLHLA